MGSGVLIVLYFLMQRVIQTQGLNPDQWELKD